MFKIRVTPIAGPGDRVCKMLQHVAKVLCVKLKRCFIEQDVWGCAGLAQIGEDGGIEGFGEAVRCEPDVRQGSEGFQIGQGEGQARLAEIMLES